MLTVQAWGTQKQRDKLLAGSYVILMDRTHRTM
jgi:hypothetical protein